MKVKIFFDKKAEGEQDKLLLQFSTIDNSGNEISECPENQGLINKVILRLCIKPHGDGWMVRTLSDRMRKHKFDLWEVVGLNHILTEYDSNLFVGFNKDYKYDLNAEKELAQQEGRSTRKILSPAMRMYRHLRENGQVRDFQQHFEKYGVSEATFYRWFHDSEEKGVRKDMRPSNDRYKASRGMGVFRLFEMKGLAYYLDSFHEVNENINPIPGIEGYIINTNL